MGFLSAGWAGVGCISTPTTVPLHKAALIQNMPMLDNKQCHDTGHAHAHEPSCICDLDKNSVKPTPAAKQRVAAYHLLMHACKAQEFVWHIENRAAEWCRAMLPLSVGQYSRGCCLHSWCRRVDCEESATPWC
jgi:hypothetical protein